jgi:hypothetical protein
MIEWVLISNNLNAKKIAYTKKVLSLSGTPTVATKRGFAFRLSKNDFDIRGDMRSFSSAVF